jgi:hypothetical protein
MRGKKKMFTCQNPSCRKSFTVPLKTLNLQQTQTEPYFSCPYCLTQIKIEPIKPNYPTEETLLEKAQPKMNQAETKENLVKNSDKPSGCHYHTGYLSERSSKEEIPDECLVCKDIVDCMLKKMHQ